MSARNSRHGRRGGGWADPGTGTHRQALTDALAKTRDGRQPVELAAEVLFHPETIAHQRAHERSCTHARDAECPAVPDSADLAELWAGRARMAAARQAAGRFLDRLDTQAVTRAALSLQDLEDDRAPKEAAS